MKWQSVMNVSNQDKINIKLNSFVLKLGAYALMYDLVSDTPAPVLDEMVREFGKLRTIMFWLHGFEEPFYSRRNYELLAQPTLFKEGQTRFLGVLCCLILKK